MKHFLILVGLLFLVLSAVSFSIFRVEAAPPVQTAQDGKLVFQQKCSGCHTIGGGKLVGPDLKDVTKRVELSWMKDFISNPSKMIDSGDPVAVQLLADYNNLRMPTLGLSENDLTAVIAYLENPAAAGSAVAPSPAALPPGQALAGQQLFTGQRRLSNGGPPCVACHTVSGIGFLEGGALGPDLTHVPQRLGEAGLASALNQIAFPTMAGPFLNHPLTPQEQADLVAYFVWSDAQPPAPARNSGIYFLAIGAGGALLLFGVLAVFWPGQRESLAERLRRQRKESRWWA
jgi:mono/diheme cytochrome c family protein